MGSLCERLGEMREKARSIARGTMETKGRSSSAENFGRPDGTSPRWCLGDSFVNTSTAMRETRFGGSAAVYAPCPAPPPIVGGGSSRIRIGGLVGKQLLLEGYEGLSVPGQ